MDDRRFDNLTRALGRAASRRGMLRGLAAGLAAALVARGGGGAQRPTPLPNGAACTSAGQCASFRCVDGVCCDTSCAGQCESCETGACLPVAGAPVGGRPACSGAGVCRATCNGVTRTHCAAYPGPEVACADPVCADGWQTTHACGGNGTCQPITTSCGLFVCDPAGATCAPPCATHADCVAHASCVNGQCVGDICVNGGCGAACPVGGFCLGGSSAGCPVGCVCGTTMEGQVLCTENIGCAATKCADTGDCPFGTVCLNTNTAEACSCGGTLPGLCFPLCTFAPID